MSMEISSIDKPLRLGKGFKAPHPLHWVCNVCAALYHCGTTGKKTHIPWLCSCCWCWCSPARILPGFRSAFPEEWGEKKQREVGRGAISWTEV